MWAKIITIKRTKDLNYFNMCALNLFNTQVSQFELNYWKKLLFHDILIYWDAPVYEVICTNQIIQHLDPLLLYRPISISRILSNIRILSLSKRLIDQWLNQFIQKHWFTEEETEFMSMLFNKNIDSGMKPVIVVVVFVEWVIKWLIFWNFF